MEFNLSDIFAPNWLNAFGAMLFHSLWLGLLLSFLVAIIIFSTRKATAGLRYNLLTGAMFLFVLAVSFVFCKSFNYPEILKIRASATEQIAESISTPNSIAANKIEAGIDGLMNIWNIYSPEIVLLWLIVICIKSIHLFVGLNGVYHLKRNKIYAAGIVWEEKLDVLAHQFGIKIKIGIMQSGLAQVPMVIGHFKPLILIPLGLLNSISTEEVEAILYHELAHIKRKDYLVNLLQSFVEIIFFFNPAVIWLSKLIRDERENCCDDLAVAKIENKKNYVKALIVCQEFQLNAPKYAMAFSNKKSPLFKRVSRMLYNNQKTLNRMEKTILSAALVSVMVFSAAFKNLSAKDTYVKNTVDVRLNQPAQSLQDSLKNKLVKQKVDAVKKEVERQRTNLDLEKEIAIRMESQELKSKASEGDAKSKLADEKFAVEQKKYDAEQKKYESEQKRYESEQKRYEVEQKIRAEIQKAREKRGGNNNKFPVPPTPPAPPSHGALNVPVAAPVPPIAPDEEVFVKQQLKLRKSSSKTSVSTSSQTSVESVSVTDADESEHKKIIKEMIKDGLIKNEAKFSFFLDKNSLIVNDKKQSEQAHQKYKSKYLPSISSVFLYQNGTSKRN
ncbi:M56 family metallopeptidase [Pedobacter aquatilis]|uniref:M56 family metallopeptidase n=1 Tax=Pedobacter aquatilis TaxID=351343 RepID=UPI0025B54A66|nr:M56 family metallopeptidase [Pedobacter aquatilis]MDN3585926.1 M56 family metallopeptidase [Pedobacter aquatilis]